MSQGQMCMSSRIQNSKLHLVCKIHHLHLEVLIKDPSNRLEGQCLLPFPEPSCFSENGEIVQNLLTNQTSLTVERISSKYVSNGQWTCLHGSYMQKSSKHVSINKDLEDNKSFIINLEGPKYVKKSQSFLLICSSNAEPVDTRAVISVKEGQTSKTEDLVIECKNTTSCSKSGIFEFMYKGSKSSGILTFECQMKFKLAGNLSDCVFVTVVDSITSDQMFTVGPISPVPALNGSPTCQTVDDMTGPTLSLNTTLPLFDETWIKLTCTAWSSEGEIIFRWECFNATSTDSNHMNDTTHTFVSELAYRVTMLDHDRNCFCQAQIGHFTSSESITIIVKKQGGFHIRLLFWTLTAAFILIITVVIFSMEIKRRAQPGVLERVCSVPAIYYAAPQQDVSVNIYDGMESHYNEIDDSQI